MVGVDVAALGAGEEIGAAGCERGAMSTERPVKVLIVGEHLAPLRKCFPGAFLMDSLPTGGGDLERFSVILLHSSTLGSLQALQEMVGRATRAAAGQSVVIFAENPLVRRGGWWTRGFSFFDRWQLFRGHLARLCPPLHGFLPPRRFLPGSRLDRVEELLADDLPRWSRKRDSIPFTKKGRLFPSLADGCVLVALSAVSRVSLLVQDVVDMISNHVEGRAACIVERVDIRSRGAIVIFLVEMTTGRGFIARLVMDEASDNIIARNSRYLEYLHGQKGIGSLQHLLPLIVGQRSRSGVKVYVETRLQGEIAWKALGVLNRRRAERGMEWFLAQLTKGTGHTVVLDQGTLETLFSDDMGVIRNCPLIEKVFLDELCATVSRLYDKLLGLSVQLVCSHGDFGFGNVLVRPVTGDLAGVIDWDTGKSHEFPAVDLMNHYIQRERIRRGCNFYEAFRTVVELRPADVPLAEFYLDSGIFEVLHYVTFIRYLARSAQYHQLFKAHYGHYVAAHEMLLAREPL